MDSGPEKRRCIDCTCYIKRGKRCDYCQQNPLPILDVCIVCGEFFDGQTDERWQDVGNWCDDCLEAASLSTTPYIAFDEDWDMMK